MTIKQRAPPHNPTSYDSGALFRATPEHLFYAYSSTIPLKIQGGLGLFLWPRLEQHVGYDIGRLRPKMQGHLKRGIAFYQLPDRDTVIIGFQYKFEKGRHTMAQGIGITTIVDLYQSLAHVIKVPWRTRA
jgi:hypothetical protein